MYFRILSILLIITSFLLSSCAPKHSDIVVAKYGDDKVTLGEFEQVYAKNVGGVEVAKKDSLKRIKDFLDLYVNFKMKLKDAELRGYKKNSALDAELKEYKEKVGSSYLIEKEVVDPGLKDLYEKRKYELRVSHLMIRPDTISDEKAKQLTASLIDSIKHGKKFEDLVKKYSADVYSKNDGGDIYYITAGMIIPEFEDAAYNTKAGEIYPEPVKTRFGYHIIKVTEKKERVPQIRASHILIDFKNDSSKVDSAAALAKITDIKKQLDNGAKFDSLAKIYSKDPGSKVEGGDLGFFERRQMVKEFDEAAFNLKVGQVSNIVKTSFGYHLIKLTDKKPYPSFEEDKENLKKLFKKSRYDQAYSAYLIKLKNQFNFKINDGVLNLVAGKSDTTKLGPNYYTSKWRADVKDSVIYSLNNKAFTVDTLIAAAEQLPDFENKVINKALLTNAINKDVETKVLDLQVQNLESKDDQFASLMDEYRNGIYIFKLQEDEVWNKIQTDSVKIYDFYNKKVSMLKNESPDSNNPEIKSLKEKLMWPDRVSFIEIFAKKDSVINKYYTMIEKGGDFKTIANNTERPGMKEKSGVFDLVDVNLTQHSKEANALKNPGDYSKPFKNGNGYSIVKLIAKEPARIKTFEEAKAEISGLYQEAEAKRLENEYVTSLKGIYKPVLYYNKVEEAFKSN
jgi:peptidyl-prolyl cis-trans isomerase SurA